MASSGRKLFFLEDYAIHEKHNVYRNVSQALKHPEPVMAADRDWEYGTVELHQGTVLYCEDEKLFKMWYTTGHGYVRPATDQPEKNICYAISKDGVNWEKPNLGICQFGGSRDNNIVLTKHKSGGGVNHMPSVIKKDSGYEMYFWTYGKGFLRALSNDGIHWNLTKDKVFSHVNEMGLRGRHSNDEAKVIYNPLTREYECYHVPLVLPASAEDVVEYDSAPHIKRILGRMVSEDGVNWSETKIIIEPDQDDPRGMQFYGMVAWPNTGMYLGPYYLGLIMAYDCVKQTIELELGYSAGGEQWFRADRHRPFVPRGPKGSWDEGMILSACSPVKVGDEHWIYYMGTRGRHYENVDPRGEHHGWFKASVGIAKIGIDRFCSLDCPGEGGLVTTRLIRGGEKLAVNLDATKGVAYVEILDEWFSPIKGFTRQDCDPIDTDSTSRTVTWKGKSDISGLRGVGVRRIRLKFYLHRTDLYSAEML